MVQNFALETAPKHVAASKFFARRTVTASVFMEHPTLGFELSNWLAGLLVLVLGVIVPLVVVARHNRLFFGGGGASLPKRSH